MVAGVKDAVSSSPGLAVLVFATAVLVEWSSRDCGRRFAVSPWVEFVKVMCEVGACVHGCLGRTCGKLMQVVVGVGDKEGRKEGIERWQRGGSNRNEIFVGSRG